MNIETELTTITPAQAAAWLANNDKNRALNKSRVAGYAKIMKAGQWQLNGESIKFSEDGDLIDGQHRLHAVVRAAMPIQAIVIRNLPADSFETIDTGRRRSVSDVLGVKGEHNANFLGSALSLIRYYEDGTLRSDTRRYHGDSGNIEMLEAYKRHPRLQFAVEEIATAYNARRFRFASPSALIVAYYLMSSEDRDRALKFMHALISGEDLKQGDPILALRNRLINLRSSGVKEKRGDTLAAIGKAWRYKQADTPLMVLSLKEHENAYTFFPREEDKLEESKQDKKEHVNAK